MAETIKVKKVLWPAILGLAILLLASSGWGQEKPAHRFTLPNGLTVILQELHSANVVALELWVKAGSLTETDKEAGISHLFEHMLFKGTSKRKVGQIAKEVESLGGDINAFTSLDYTVYYLVLSSRYLDEGLDILADAVFNSTFASEELKKEKEVVLEEWRRAEDRPARKLTKKLFATIFTVHPYRRPVIGYRETIQSFSRKDILAYFQKWYRPENMVLALAGDFDSEQVVEKVSQLFGRVPARGRISLAEIEEPAQDKARAFVIKGAVKQARLELAFRIPSVTHADVPALDLLAIILGQGRSSRLYRKVKDEKGLVYSTSASSFTPRGPGIFSVGARLEPENLARGLEELLRETYRLRGELVGPEELSKAKIQITSDAIYSKETMRGMAHKLAYFQVQFGDFKSEDAYRKAIQETTAEQIREVAGRYLRHSTLTAGVLLPEDSPLTFAKGQLLSLAERVEKELTPAVQHAPALPGKILRKVLANGMTLLVRENHAVATVALRAVFLAGTRFETRENNGINNLIANMLTRGTKSRSGPRIAQEVESMAGSLSGFSGRNSLGVSGNFLSRHFRAGIEILADVVLNSSFPAAELEKVSRDVLAAMKRREENLSSLAFYNFNRTIYKKHPYGLDPLGTPKTVKAITSKDLFQYKNRFMIPKNMVLAVVGDVQTVQVVELVEKLFGQFSGPVFSPPEVPREPPLKDIRRLVVAKDSRQTHIVVGFPGVDFADEDRYALRVLAGILSGQGGRLFLELRDRQALAYSVFAFSQEGLDPGYLSLYIASSSEKTKEAIDGIKRELVKIISEEPTAEELKRSVNNIAGSFEIGLQRNSALAATMAFNELYGLGYNFHLNYPEKILKVSAQQVLQAARKYINLDRYVLTLVGPSS